MKSRYDFLIFYALIWLAGVGAFWLFVQPSDMIAFSIIYLWCALPIATFLTGVRIGKRSLRGRWKWCIWFGVLLMLSEYLTLRLANMVKFHQLHTPEWVMIALGAVVFLVGIGIGRLMRYVHRFHRLNHKAYGQKDVKHMNKKHIVLCILGAVLGVWYLITLFTPGISYRGEFLKKQQDGRYTTKDNSYVLQIDKTEQNTEITFAIDGKQKQYEVVLLEGTHIQIYEDGVPKFEPDGISTQDLDWVTIATSDYDVIVAGQTPEKQYPSDITLYTWATQNPEQFRGYPEFLIPIVICLVFLFLDIRFPDLFYHIRYGLMVDGGEPNELYRLCQKIGRYIIVVVIMFCIFYSLFGIQ